MATAQRGLLIKQQLRCHSDVADEDKYLELKQLRDIKRCIAVLLSVLAQQCANRQFSMCMVTHSLVCSEEFYDLHGQERRYFYYIDLQVRYPHLHLTARSLSLST